MDLSLVLFNQAVRSMHDKLRRPVVLLQFKQPGTLILFLEIQNIVNISPSETIDALGIVTHHTDSSMFMCQQQDNLLLGIVGVLILIDQYILETLDIFLPDILMVTQQDKGLDKQIVEVHRISLMATFHIALIDLRHHWALVLSIVSSPRTGGILLWQQQVVLGHRDAISHTIGLIRLVVKLHLFDDAFHQRPGISLIVNSKIRIKADSFRFSPQNAGKNRMKRTHLQIYSPLLPYQSANTFFHLTCRLIGKSQCQNVPRGHALLQQIGNLIGQHTGFSRSGTGNHQLRSVTVFHRSTLPFIQFIE